MGHLSKRAPLKSKGTSFSTRALDKETDTHELLETAKPWLKDHGEQWEGARQLHTPHLCSFLLNGFLGVHSPRLLMTINDTRKAKSQEETAEAFLSQKHLFSIHVHRSSLKDLQGNQL